uniref:(northern house mosquito) hypothetical protein n=1 Tax=Culex pipiens TaxID=7175 RepID=A0A8D8KBF0_CULPI
MRGRLNWPFHPPLQVWIASYLEIPSVFASFRAGSLLMRPLPNSSVPSPRNMQHKHHPSPEQNRLPQIFFFFRADVATSVGLPSACCSGVETTSMTEEETFFELFEFKTIT